MSETSECAHLTLSITPAGRRLRATELEIALTCFEMFAPRVIARDVPLLVQENWDALP